MICWYFMINQGKRYLSPFFLFGRFTVFIPLFVKWFCGKIPNIEMSLPCRIHLSSAKCKSNSHSTTMAYPQIQYRYPTNPTTNPSTNASTTKYMKKEEKKKGQSMASLILCVCFFFFFFLPLFSLFE